ncbi:2-oxoacid:acceptor oxidoreductase subunit alpha [Ichthyobacterium seriolicida]|uniref:2-oxoglutarate oxidoreductase, alpha subunit n=1 Tax=Ichthyobacterium seriolicida TaxID=242600 RepID=A0A1J1E337_9FLAO|nr:2-oxoacid:acceptor oxidoreductase subunit alpha [Ichthyobacterium seriolicida]BAV95381.1 2-oxoglutarate oxidoreductase, alpha subunit [Ichthyobacterium seriolicida]
MLIKKKKVTILFAGDSGDGMQFIGKEFADTVAASGNDLSTLQNFPAEIRAPAGTVDGVSGFQLTFGSSSVYSVEGKFDVLVLMNVAAYKSNIFRLKNRGLIIANTSGFNKKNLRLCGYEDDENPLDDDKLDYKIYKIDIDKITQKILEETSLSKKDSFKIKNMFVLGFVYWMYGKQIDHTIDFFNSKFKGQPDILKANIRALEAGYNYGNTVEVVEYRFQVDQASRERGLYRNITGNEAISIGLIAATYKSGLDLFYSSYPITPASEILHFLSKRKNFNVKTFQAEDELAAICAIIGASFGGAFGATASSGPGISLKIEAMGLAVMLELPILVINVQRAGPSTGLPTKIEQSDLLQAMYGRNGEAPIPIIAAKSPSDCFDATYEAVKIAVEFMTPVLLLSDGYIANASEPWLCPDQEKLKVINSSIKQHDPSKKFSPYSRDENLVRDWLVPGTPGGEHRIGSLEKDIETGNVSYDSDNHHSMIKIREAKINNIAKYIPLQDIDNNKVTAKILLLGWGSTYGTIKTTITQLEEEGIDQIAHIHIRYIFPFPPNLGELLKNYEKIIVPEINNGQLSKLIRDNYLIDTIAFNRIKGIPIEIEELKDEIKRHL